MKPQTFEDYLQEFHAEDYHGTDDDMPDHFDDWLGSLDGEDYIILADKALEQERAKFEAFRKDILQDLEKMSAILNR
jgi:hypothetical protein